MTVAEGLFAAPPAPAKGVYARILERLFHDRHTPGDTEISFLNEDITRTAATLGLPRPKNPPDVLYSFKHRRAMPDRVARAAPAGMAWIIRPSGGDGHTFRAVPEKTAFIIPDPHTPITKHPRRDKIPETVYTNVQRNEQGLLSLVQYVDLIREFLDLRSTHSLQPHYATYVKGRGQIEIDQVYFGTHHNGQECVIPVEAKGGRDKLGVTQIESAIAACKQNWPHLPCQPIAAQFDGAVIALTGLTVNNHKLTITNGELVKHEARYQLHPLTTLTGQIPSWAKK